MSEGKINSWSDTLIDYLGNSNEDEVIIQNIESIIFSLNSFAAVSEINWIEIGPGSLSKTNNIYDILQHNSKNINLTFIEPSEFWIKSIKTKWIKSQFNLFSDTLENTFNKLTFNKNSIYTIIHVLYSDNVLKTFYRLLDKLQNKNTVIAVVEDITSDFHVLRSELIRNEIHSCHSHFLEIENYLTVKKISYKRLITSGKFCQLELNELDNPDYWLFPFLLGIEKLEWRDFNKKELVMEVVKDFIHKNNKEILSIEDSIFVIQK